VKGRAFQRLLAPALRSGMGQYFTPREVIRFIVDVVCPSAKERVLDPFAGSGHFLTQCADAIRMRSRQSSPAVARLHGIEKSDRMVRISSTDMLLHGLGRGDIQCADALLDFANYSDYLQAESFDLVLTNPPFGCLLGADAVRQLGRFELAIGRKTVPLEVLGLERCVQFLKPGGRLGIVLPDGVLGNSGTCYVRDWLSRHMRIRAIVSLPIETFAPLGANIKTSILFARKWHKREKRGHNYNVHLSRIDNVGYDAAGRAKPRAEFQRAARSVRTFLAGEGW
jgi:type I restriction enzyme M protein